MFPAFVLVFSDSGLPKEYVAALPVASYLLSGAIDRHPWPSPRGRTQGPLGFNAGH
jgi:hypothetical protein